MTSRVACASPNAAKWAEWRREMPRAREEAPVPVVPISEEIASGQSALVAVRRDGEMQAQGHEPEQFDVDRAHRATVGRLESRVRTLEGQGVRADRRAAEFGGLAQALTEEQRALLIRLDRLEDELRGSCRQQHRESPAVAGGKTGEEWLRRLSRLECEQRAGALNLRVVAKAVEEAQQQQHQRLRCFEEVVDGRLRPVEDRLQLQVPPRLPLPAQQDDVRGGERGGGPVGGDTRQTVGPLRLSSLYDCSEVLRADLGAAERRANRSLGAAQELLRRGESGGGDGSELIGRLIPSAGVGGNDGRVRVGDGSLAGAGDDGRLASAGVPLTQHQSYHHGGASGVGAAARALDTHGDAIMELRILLDDLGRDLVPRTDAVEARVQALTEVAEDMHRRVEALMGSEARHEHLEELRSRVAVLTDVAEARGKALEASFLEMGRRLELLPTHDQVLTACKDVHLSQSGALEEFRSQLELLAGAQAGGAGDVARSLEARADAVEGLRRKVDTPLLQGAGSLCRQQGELPVVEELPDVGTAHIAREVQFHTEAIAEMRVSVQGLLKELQERLGVALSGLRARVDEVQAQVLSTRANDDLLRRCVDGHGQELQELRSWLQSLPQRGANPGAVQLEGVRAIDEEQHLQRPDPLVEGELKELRSRCDVHDQELRVHCHVHQELRDRCDAHQEQFTRLQDNSQASGPLAQKEFAECVVSIKQELAELKQIVDQKVLVSVWRADKQLPDITEKVDRLLYEHAERVAKDEEGEVRMNLTLTKFDAHEQKIQSCMDRLERLPSTSEVRMLYHEELHKHLEQVNIEGLSIRVDGQDRLIEDLGSRVQEHTAEFKQHAAEFGAFVRQFVEEEEEEDRRYENIVSGSEIVVMQPARPLPPLPL